MLARSSVFALAFALAALLAPPLAYGAEPVTIRHIRNPPPNVNSFVITSPQGVKVFVDAVSLPDELLPELENPKNLFLVTHTHFDHLSGTYRDRFKGAKLVASTGTVTSGDVKVEGVVSSHYDNELDGTSNFIMVIEVAGVRIAHFGDCGQDALSPEQMKKIGKVDVMIGQFENSYSEADVVNQKGYKVLAQVAPTVVVPTHIASVPAVQLLDKAYPAEIAGRDVLTVTPALLGKGKRAVFMGANGELAAKAGIRKSAEL